MRSALLAAALLLFGAQPALASPAFNDGFGVRPIKRHGEAVAAAYFQLDAAPSARQRQSVVMWNSSKRTIRLIVDGVDGLTGTTAGAVYANAADPHDETSRWIRPSSRHVTLEPGQQRRYDFDVRVPEDALPGEHLGGLAFENAQTQTAGSRFAVRQVLRVVLGVQVTIPGGRPAQAELGAVSLKALPGTQVPSAVVQLANKGQLSCRPKMQLSLSGRGQRRTIDQPIDTILPGDQIAYPLAVRGRLPAGKYRVETTVRGCGAAQHSSDRIVLSGELSGTTPHAVAPTVQAAGLRPAPWWLLIGMLAAGLGGGLAGSVWWQRRRKPAPTEAR